MEGDCLPSLPGPPTRTASVICWISAWTSDAKYDGDGYFDIAKDSTALHVAAWKAWPNVVTLLLARGAP